MKRFVLVGWLICLFCSLSVPAKAQDYAPLALRGTVNLGSWSLEQNGSLALDGNWIAYKDQLILPHNDQPEAIYFQLPSIWTKSTQERNSWPSFGTATFQLTVNGELEGQLLALEIPDIYSAYNLFVNGKLLASNGTVANKKENYAPYWQPQTVPFKAQSNSLDIVWQVANYDHVKGGIKNSLVLGTEKEMINKRVNRERANLTLVYGLVILAIILIIFGGINKSMSPILFAVFSLIWAIRGLTTELYLITEFLPSLSWHLIVRIEYLTLYTALLVGLIIFKRLYPHHMHRVVCRASLAINIGFIILTLFAPVLWFTTMLSYFFVFLGLNLLYILYAILNVIIQDEKGSNVLGVAVCIIIALFFYDLFSFQQIIFRSPYVISLGYLIIYYLLAFSMLKNIREAKSTKSAISMRDQLAA